MQLLYICCQPFFFLFTLDCCVVALIVLAGHVYDLHKTVAQFVVARFSACAPVF